MKISKKLLLTFFSLCWFLVWSQNFYPPLVNYSIKDYGKDRNPENYCVIQDRRGVMYFGTSHGVHEFDGEKWNFIQVGFGAYTRSLAVDSTGIIYVGTYGDFGYLTPDTSGALQFQSLKDELPEEDQFFSNIWRIFATNSEVYFQAEEALFQYDLVTKELQTYQPATSFHTSFLVNNELYLRQRDVGLVHFKNGEFKPLMGTEPFAGYGVFGLHQLKDDSLLIFTQELGAFKWANNKMRQLKPINPTRMEEWGIFGSIELSDGNFALNTFTNGAIIVDENARLIRKIDRAVGIRSDIVHGIFQDRDLNIWLALENGISKVNYHSPLSYFDEKTGVEGNVQAMIRFKGKLYVGSSYGLFVQDTDLFGARKFKNTRIVRAQVWDFEIVDEELIVSSANGVFKSIDGVNFQQINNKNSTVVLYHDQKEQFIVGEAGGIFIYDKNFNEIWGLSENFSTFLGAEIDPNNAETIWLGTTSSGAIRLQYQQDGMRVDQYGDFAGLLDGMGKPMLFEDQLIFGAKNGLFYFVHEDIIKEELKSQLTEEELANPEITKGIFEPYLLKDSLFNGQFLLLEKGKDRIWYCNEFKIGYYDEAQKSFINRPFWGIDYGRINAFYLEENGVFWIGAAEGLIRFEKNQLKKYKSEFHALIRRVELTRGDTLFNGVFMSPNGSYSLQQATNQIPEVAYKFNDIRYLFSAPYFEDEHQPRYRYMLEGYDEDWSDWQTKSEIGYNNLHEGKYTFKVEAQNVYGQISQQAAYSFVILPPWYRTNWAYVLYVILFILILFIGVKISSIRLKAKNQWLEGVVEERTKEISTKNIVLEHQKQEIEDSINYAQRIQEAILPLEEEMKKWVPNSFVLFRPKDIVSGDFYWFIAREDKLVLICADCTGHGVPGAFMSMIGSDRLNNIVSEKKITSPSAILSELNRAIKKSLKQDGQKNATRDGMDAAVCTVDLKEGVLKYAGANRPLWVLNAANELTEIKATKVAVAGFTADDQEYEEHTISLEKQMKFYMTTDGYADQFGGENDKKFKVKTLKNLIQTIADEPFDFQKQKLERALLEWMGKYEQVDDVCVVGFKIDLP